MNFIALNDISLKLVFIFLNLSYKSLLILFFIFFVNKVIKSIPNNFKQIIFFSGMVSILFLPSFCYLTIKFLNFVYLKFPELVIFNPGLRALRNVDYGLIDTVSPRLNEFLPVDTLNIMPIRLSWAFYLICLWLAGFIFFIITFILGKIGILKIVKESSIVKDNLLLNELDVITGKLDLKKNIKIYSSEKCQLPLTFWFFGNYILLPEEFLTWSEKKREIVLVHEFIHVKKHDCVQKYFLRLICSFLWFNPIIWYLYKEFNIELEKSCDTFLIKKGFNKYEYANQLVEIARKNASVPLFSSNFIQLTDKKTLERRIWNIVNSHVIACSYKRVLFLLLFFTFLLLPLLVINPFVTTTKDEIENKLEKIKNKKKPTNITEISPKILPAIYKIPLIWPTINGEGLNEKESIFALKFREWIDCGIKEYNEKEKKVMADKIINPYDNGVYISSLERSPIVATADGVVESICTEGLLKSYIVIRHANGIKTYYSFLDDYNVDIKKNKNVKQGQIIAYPVLKTMIYNNTNNNQYIFHYMIKFHDNNIESKEFLVNLDSRLYYSY